VTVRAALLVAALLAAACGQDDKPAPKAGDPAPAPAAPASPAQAPVTPAHAGDPEKGRQVYLGQCVACHNRDPAKDGPLGPAVKGSSRALLETRIVRGQYPPGYKPKRDSSVMPPRPDLAPAIGDLTAYLR